MLRNWISRTSFGMMMFVLLPFATMAQDTIYLDLTSIDTLSGINADQKHLLKSSIRLEVQNNLNAAAAKKFVVSTNPADRNTAARRVDLIDMLGRETAKDGTTDYFYGEWYRGSKVCSVYLKNFTERHSADYKTGTSWDLTKLTNGIGRTISHELAHSYGVGHNRLAAPNKMTEGGLVPSAVRATKNDWSFDAHTASQLQRNQGKAPARTTAAYDGETLKPYHYENPALPHDFDEFGYFDAWYSLSGLMADQYDLGWYGPDGDGGAFDGAADFDFIHAGLDVGDTELTSYMMTFFEVAHSTTQFVLRPKSGSGLYEEWIPMELADILPSNYTMTPTGVVIFRTVMISWDTSGDGLFDDLVLTLQAQDVYRDLGTTYNGWELRFVPEPETALLLGTGLLCAALQRRRKHR